MVTLVVTAGSLEGRRIDIERDTVIGREDADIELDDTEISRRHVMLRLVDGALEVEDLGSRNGTFVDGARLSGATRVENGAVLKVGQTKFAVEAPVRAGGETVASAASGTVVSQRVEPAAGRTPADDGPRRRPGPAPSAGPARAPVEPEPARPFGSFTPPTRRRRRKAATRLWIPQALTYASVLGTAAALIVYFVGR